MHEYTWKRSPFAFDVVRKRISYGLVHFVSWIAEPVSMVSLHLNRIESDRNVSYHIDRAPILNHIRWDFIYIPKSLTLKRSILSMWIDILKFAAMSHQHFIWAWKMKETEKTKYAWTFLKGHFDKFFITFNRWLLIFEPCRFRRTFKIYKKTILYANSDVCVW